MATKKKQIEPGSFDDLEGLARLPEESISPVFRVHKSGRTLFANRFTRETPVLYDAKTKKFVPQIIKQVKESFKSRERAAIDFEINGAIYEVQIIPVDGSEYVNGYGRDVTEMRDAVKRAADLAKFPNENPNPVMRAQGNGTVLFCNHAAEALPGVLDLGPPVRLSTLLATTAAEAMRTRQITTVHHETGEQTFMFTLTPVHGEEYLNIYGRDITPEIEAQNALVAANEQLERRVAERTASVRLLQNIVLAANSADSLEAALQTALHEICIYTNWPVGHAYIVQSRNGQDELVPSGIWHIETSSALSDLRSATENLRFGDTSGLPGKVVQEGREVWVENLASYKDLRRAPFIEKAGLKAGMAFPVTINTQVIGVLEFFSQDIAPTNIEVIKTLEHVGAQLGSVAERKAAEAAVKQSQKEAELSHARLTDALEVIGQGFVLFDKDDNIALFNSKYAERVHKILGRDPVLGDSFETLMRATAEVGYIPGSTDDKEEWFQKTMRERRETKTRDSISKQNDGTWFRAEGYETSDGGTVSVFTDVTALKEQEEKMAELAREAELAHNRLRDAVEAIGQGFVIFDAEDRFVLFNQRYLDVMAKIGHSPKIGQRFEDVIRDTKRTDFPGSSKEEWIQGILKNRREQPTRSSTAQIDGRWFQTEGYQTREGGIVSIFTDITDMKEKEDELAELARAAKLSHTRLNDAIESLSQAFILYDKDDRVVMLNEQARQLWVGASQDGKPPQIGETFETFLRRTNNPKRKFKTDAEREAWYVSVMENRSANKVRKSVDHLPDGRYIRSEGFETSEGGIVSIFTDITEEKEHEAELDKLVKELGVARDAAVEANSAKSQFLANMSHELRTPLNAIIGYSELLIDDAADDENDDYIPDLEKIQKAGKHLLGLINDILDLSKIEVGKIELFIEEFAINDMLEDVTNTIKPLMEKNNNVLELEIDKAVSSITSDLTKIRQNLFNLLSNASKFSKDSTVTVKVFPEVDQGLESLVFEVIDKGVGMTEAQLERVFDPFTQADASTSKNYGGTGLGLTITREFSRMLGGDITATSQVGLGTTFTMKVRTDANLIKSDTEDDDTGAPVRAGTGAPLVLIIDDDPSVRELLRRNLDVAGYRTETARNGDEGIELAKRLNPDAITLDVIMPKTDGWTVLSKLKADPKTADIPVVMLTISEDRNLGYSLGASEFLTKPINRKKLVQVLDKFLADATERSVLLVEDDEATRAVMRKYLDKEKIDVVEAENGRIGLEAIEKARPSLILLDLMMPEMDGFQFIEEFRKHPEWSDIPIIVVTAKILTKAEKTKLEGWVEALYSKSDADIDHVLAEVSAQLPDFAKPGADDA